MPAFSGPSDPADHGAFLRRFCLLPPLLSVEEGLDLEAVEVEADVEVEFEKDCPLFVVLPGTKIFGL